MPIYMQIPGIDGNATATGYSKQFQLQSLAWGVSNNGPKSKPSFSSVNVMKNCDIHSPSLMLACATGRTLGNVVITLTSNTSSGAQQVLDVITLGGAYIQSQQVSGESHPLSESYSIGFSKIDWKQIAYDAGGKNAITDERFWDLSTNTGG